MSKLCPDCMNQVDMSVTGIGSCTECQTVFVNMGENADSWSVRKAPSKWTGK